MTKKAYDKLRTEKFRTNDYLRHRKRGRYFTCGAKDKRLLGKWAEEPSSYRHNGIACYGGYHL